MPDFLRITPEDVEEVRRQARQSSLAPQALTIQAGDGRPGRVRSVGRPLTITEDDLRPTGPVPAAPAAFDALETYMFGAINGARQEHLPNWLGNRQLRWRDDLSAVARGHAADMLRRQYVDHTSPERIRVAERLERHGLRFLACGENIGVLYGPDAAGERAIDEIQQAFMNQPSRLRNHRGNILNPIWTHVGVGAAGDGRGVLIVTQNFIWAPGQ